MEKTLNERLHVALGKCWHEVDDLTLGLDGEVYCKHCWGMWQPLPDYCASISDAFSLVEWMRKERGMMFEIESTDYIWEVVIRPGTIEIVGGGSHESLPMAISLACLKALGVEP